MTSLDDPLHTLRTRCQALRDQRPDAVEDLALDRDLALSLASELGLALEAAVEAMHTRLQQLGLPATATFSQAVTTLQEHGVVGGKLAAQLITLGQLRRAGTDGYTGIDTQRLHEALADGVPQLEKLAGALGHA